MDWAGKSAKLKTGTFAKQMYIYIYGMLGVGTKGPKWV